MIVITRSIRIDWPRIVANLQTKGMSLQQIADELDVSKSLVAGWVDAESTGEPAFWTGAVLIEVWCKRTGLTWPDLPTRRVMPSVSQVLRDTA
jgi:orotate phosphoribosyltransferase-like protein